MNEAERMIRERVRAIRGAAGLGEAGFPFGGLHINWVVPPGFPLPSAQAAAGPVIDGTCEEVADGG